MKNSLQKILREYKEKPMTYLLEEEDKAIADIKALIEKEYIPKDKIKKDDGLDYLRDEYQENHNKQAKKLDPKRWSEKNNDLAEKASNKWLQR